jgi:hypothetical protein
VTPEKVLLVDVAKLVAVQTECRRVHGNQDGDVAVVVAGAGDDVEGPVGIVLALAAEGALHAAVAGVKVAAHAAREAVRFVRAEKVFFGKVNDEGRFDGFVDVVITAVVDADEFGKVGDNGDVLVGVVVDRREPG